VSAIAQVGRLSALQLRLHYIIYRQLWIKEAASPTLADLRSAQAMTENSEIYLRLNDLEVALSLEPDGDGVRKMLSALHVLAREDLIAPQNGRDGSFDGVGVVGYDIQQPWRLSTMRPRTFPAAGLICSPTPIGVELFLRGCGWPNHDPTYIRELPADLVQAPVPDVGGSMVADLPSQGWRWTGG